MKLSAAYASRLYYKNMCARLFTSVLDRTLSSGTRRVPRRDLTVQSTHTGHRVVRLHHTPHSLTPPPFCCVPQEHSASGSDEDWRGAWWEPWPRWPRLTPLYILPRYRSEEEEEEEEGVLTRTALSIGCVFVFLYCVFSLKSTWLNTEKWIQNNKKIRWVWKA